MLGPGDKRNLLRMIKQPKVGRDPKQFTQQVPLSLMSEYQIHGHDDIIANRPYTSSLVCVSNHSTAFRIHRNDFIKLFRGDSESWIELFRMTQQQEYHQKDSTINFYKVQRASKT